MEIVSGGVHKERITYDVVRSRPRLGNIAKADGEICWREVRLYRIADAPQNRVRDAIVDVRSWRIAFELCQDIGSISREGAFADVHPHRTGGFGGNTGKMLPIGGAEKSGSDEAAEIN